MTPLLGIALVALALGLAVALAAGLRRAGLLGPEPARKAVHVALGLVVAAFPWLFAERWPVWILAAVAIAALLALRVVPGLRRGLGGALHDVERVSWGDLCFPLAVAVVWTLAPGDPLRYSLPLLVLAVGDATAALVGIEYGRRAFTTREGSKSWEGSIAFFATTFLVIHVPLLLGTDLGRAECLLIALIFGLLMMVVEAIAWRGLDNLFIPLIGFLFLDAWLPLDLAQLVERAVVALVLVLFVMVYRRRTTLDDAAVLGGALAGYVAYAVGGPVWLLPPLVLLVTYTRLSPSTVANSARVHDILAVVAVTGPGLLWLLLDHRSLVGDGLLPYAAGYAAQLGCIGVARLAAERADWSLARVVSTAAALAGSLMLIPMLAVPACGLREPRILLIAAAAPLAATAFALWQPGIRDCPIDAWRWWRQAACATAASTLGLL